MREETRRSVKGDFENLPEFVAAAGRVYASSSRGTVVVWKAGDALEVLARNVLGEPITATPAIVGDTIYIRAGSHLRAFAAR